MGSIVSGASALGFGAESTLPLQRIAQRLALRGVACSGGRDGSLSVPAAAPTGFEIAVFQIGGGFTLCFGGLEEHAENDSDVVDWVTRASNGEFRLRTDYIGGEPSRWSLERMDRQGVWVTVFQSGHSRWFQQPRNVRTEYRCNVQIHPVALAG